MRAVLLIVALSLAAIPAFAGEALVMRQSRHPVAETMDRLVAAAEAKGLKIMARIDHAAGAEAAGLKLRPTQVLLFGNPKLGTPLIEASPAIGIDLPLRVLAYEDDAGVTWLAYTKPEVLRSRHGVAAKDELFAAMGKTLDALTASAGE
jgi:uncharacterized protein (DUF302 family)